MLTKTAEQDKKDRANRAQTGYLPALFLLLTMAGAFLLLDAVLPLHGLWFHTALLVPLSRVFLLPTDLLFHGWALSPTLLTKHNTPGPAIGLSWQETALLLVACLLLLLCYLLALRVLPGRIGRRYLVGSTLLLGALCVLIPVVTSQDVFSYIIYARMAILYHLNPLSTSPQSIASDPLYAHLYWTNQPSAYGPMWTMITCILQWATDLFGTNNIAAMVLALRLLGLCSHLLSTLLVWSIAGRLQEMRGVISQKMRMQATLAFAWNPLLLFEACVNAHNDTVLLPFLLLAIWLFVRQARLSTPHIYPTCVGAALLLAAATCIKVNLVLLFPAFLLYLWRQPRRVQSISLLTFLYIASIVGLYALFWQNGAILSIVQINPGTYRDINTVSEFLSHFYNSVAALFGAPLAADIGSPAESFTRMICLLIFAGLYCLCCWQALRRQTGLQTPTDMVRWMALAWLLYCAIGTPWFWPWYTAIFFALFALLEATDAEKWKGQPLFGFLRLPLAVRLLAFSLLSLYCFYTWAPYASMVPGLPGFRWAYLRGLWAWLLPLLLSIQWPLRLGKQGDRNAPTTDRLTRREDRLYKDTTHKIVWRKKRFGCMIKYKNFPTIFSAFERKVEF